MFAWQRARQVIPALEEEVRRHKTPYADTLRQHIRDMQHPIPSVHYAAAAPVTPMGDSHRQW